MLAYKDINVQKTPSVVTYVEVPDKKKKWFYSSFRNSKFLHNYTCKGSTGIISTEKLPAIER